MRNLQFTKVATVKTTGWITVEADTDEEAMIRAKDGEFLRYQEISHEYDDEDWEFEKEG